MNPAGKLRDRIRIETKSVSQDPDYGTPVVAWVTLATVWAHVADEMPSKSSAEKNTSGMRVGSNQARIRIRWRADLTSDMRIVLLSRANRVCKIISHIAELGVREATEFMVETFTASGDAS